MHGSRLNTHQTNPEMPWCMHRDISFCCCGQLPHIVFGRDATYYPKCKLLRVKNQLFCMRSTVIGRHAMQRLVSSVGSSSFFMYISSVYNNRIYLSFTYSVMLSSGGISMEIPSRNTCGVEYLCSGLNMLVHVRRVQRAAKRYMLKKRQERALALMMASHARLGAGSLLEGLHVDVLALILAK